jgi:hypothetical protein
MHKTTDPERMREATVPRTQNPEWGFYGTCQTNGHADVEGAWAEAIGILTDPDGRFRLELEVARDLLDAPWGRHLANEAVGSNLTDVVADLAADRRWMKSTLKITQAIVAARADDGR